MQIDSFVISNTAGPQRSAAQHDRYGYGDGKATYIHVCWWEVVFF